MSVKSMKPWRESGVALVDGFVPGVRSEVVDLSTEMQHGVSQSVILRPAISVGHDHAPLRLGTSDLFDDGQHRRDTRTSAGQQQRRVCRRQYEVTGRGTDIEQISELDMIMEVAGNAAVWGPVRSLDPPHGDLQPSPYSGGRHRVLPGLPVTIGQVDENRDVLSGCDSWEGTAVCWFEDKSDDVSGFLDAADHAVGASRLRRGPRSPAGRAVLPRRPAGARTANRPRSRPRRSRG